MRRWLEGRGEWRTRALAALVVVLVVPGSGADDLRNPPPTAPSRQLGRAADARAAVRFRDLAAAEAAGGRLAPPEKRVHRPKPGPERWNRGAGAARPAGDELVPTSPGGIASPAAEAEFRALEDNNTSLPPDTHGAAGPSHLMVTLNTQVRIQDRAGASLSTVSLDGFWASLGSPSVFDPKVLYDPYGNRWIFVSCADPAAASSAVLVGVSQSSDPTGGWNLYRFDADPANTWWVDYPSVGFNKKWIVLQVNLFGISGGFGGSQIYAFDKADLYAGGTGLHARFTDPAGFTQVPATTYDPDLEEMYLAEDWTGDDGDGNGLLRLGTITGAVGAEVLNTELARPAVSAPWADNPPGGLDFAPQLGSTRKIQLNDARLQNLVYRNGHLWTVHTVFLPAGTATRASVQWWKLSPTGTVVDRGRIDDPGGGQFYAFPSIAANRIDDVLVGFTRFSASQYASANYALRRAGDPPGTLREDRVFKSGEAPYYKTFGGSENRWGDYSALTVDPLNDADFWTVQEYAASPSAGFDRWGTWWAFVRGLSRAGAVALDAPGYRCDGAIGVEVADLDLVGAGSTTVGLTSGREPVAEPLTLTETVPMSGVFLGVLPLVVGSATADGSLQVADADTVTATYADADDGSGSPASVSRAAPVDCAAPLVTVLSPNGGEVLMVGSQATIEWLASDNAAVAAVDLAWSANGPGGPFNPIASGVANTGSRSWTVPGASSSNVWLRVTARDALDNLTVDLSDAAFTIRYPAPVLASINPAALSTAGGTTVSLGGSGFRSGARVRFGSGADTGGADRIPLSITPSVVRVTAPAHLGGRFDLRIANSDGQASTIANGVLFQSFDDVPENVGWFFEDVEAIRWAGITRGCNVTPPLYCPSDLVLREQMAAFLTRGLGAAPDPAPPALFIDVPEGAEFFGEIQTLGKLGITRGCGGGRYCPDDPVLRRQMAAFLIRTLGAAEDFTPPQLFGDVPPADPDYGWIQALARRGITLGCGGGRFCPNEAVSRAQMASFLARTFALARASDERTVGARYRPYPEGAPFPGAGAGVAPAVGGARRRPVEPGR